MPKILNFYQLRLLVHGDRIDSQNSYVSLLSPQTAATPRSDRGSSRSG